MKIKKKVQEAANELGFQNPRKFQINPINSILDHQDTLVIAPTSAGKSPIFQIPAIIGAKRGEWTLVMRIMSRKG